MIDLKQIQAFVYVVEECSFEKAATLLHISQSAVSQRIKALESQMGQALLIRSTPLRPTEAGRKLLGYYQQISLLQHELLAELHDEQQPSAFSNQHKIRIALNADSLATWFLSAIAPVIEEHHLLVDLKIDDQDQTHELLKNGEVIGCISSTKPKLHGCYSVLLGYMDYFPVCSPSFKKRYFSRVIKASEFRTAPAVEFNHKDKLQEHYLQHFWGIESGDYPFHQVPSSEGFLEFISLGLGWGMVPELQAEPWLTSKSLVKLTPDKSIPVPLYWCVWNLKSSTIKHITRELVEQAGQVLAHRP